MVQAAAVSPKAIPKEPYSAHGMALLGHGHPDPGSLELRGPRAPQGQRAHFHPAALPGFCSALRQLPAPAQGSPCVPWTDLPARGRDAVPGGVTAKPGRVLAALQHSEEGKGQTCPAGELGAGLAAAGRASRVTSLLSAGAGRGRTDWLPQLC